jgi:hypothetical protein
MDSNATHSDASTIATARKTNRPIARPSEAHPDNRMRIIITISNLQNRAFRKWAMCAELQSGSHLLTYASSAGLLRYLLSSRPSASFDRRNLPIFFR